MTHKSESRSSHELIQTGLELLYNSEPENAIGCFEQALGFQKANPDGYYFLARAFIDLKNVQAAVKTIELAQNRLPEIFGEDGNFGHYPRFENIETDTPQALLNNRTLVLREKDAPILKSHAALERGITLIDQGAHTEAVEPLMKALETNIWNVHAYYYLGQAFANSGEYKKSVAVFEQAISRFPFAFGQSSRFGEYQGLAIDSKTVIAYYDAFSKRQPDVNSFIAPCPRYGIAGVKLEPSNEAKLEATYHAAIEDWRQGKLSVPALSNVFLPDSQAENTERYGAHIMVVAPRYIKCSPDWDEYEVSFHLAGTGKSVLPNFSLHYADEIHTESHQLAAPRSDAELRIGIDGLRDDIAEKRPDILLFEGSFMGGLQCISRDQLKELKEEFKFKLATLVIDINPPLENYAAYWSEVSDLIVAMNENPYLEDARVNCPVIVYPGIPIDLDLFDSITPPERDLGALFIGARKRYRDMWCAHMIEANVPLHMKFTIQSLEHSIRAHEFIEMHKRSRLIFNNGLVSSSEHGLNLRIFEAVASGAVLLQQDFNQLHDYFVPYVHYAPFNNVHEMVATAQFLLKRDDIAMMITEAALDWYKECYGGKRFWHKLIDHLSES
jgi:tetratricopeptide (TPR) repeat protein